MGWKTKDYGLMPGRGKSSSSKHPYSLLALDLSSLLFSGYQGLFLQGEKMSEHEANHPPQQNNTTTHVMPSWRVDTASMHIDILLLFQNSSLKIGMQPTHKFLQNATNTFHIPLFFAPDYLYIYTQYTANQSKEPCYDHKQSSINSQSWHHIFDWHNNFFWNQGKYVMTKPFVKTLRKGPIWFFMIWHYYILFVM